MPLPPPEPGLVIGYAYLWRSEARRGRTEGAKNRPCVVVLAVERREGETLVVIAPVPHSQPDTLDDSVEIPLATKRRLGLDERRSWIVTTEVNRFRWPGPDLRPMRRDTPNQFGLGVLPPALFAKVKSKIAACAREQRLRMVPRREDC